MPPVPAAVGIGVLGAYEKEHEACGVQHIHSSLLAPFWLFWGFVSGMELSTLESRAFN